MPYLTHIGPAALAILAALTGACSGGEQSRSAGAETGKSDSAALAASVGDFRAPRLERDDRETRWLGQPHHRADVRVRPS